MESIRGPGIVYVLTNPAMPGLVKIGKTARNSVHARLDELYQTGVPVPFECAYAARVDDEAKVERAFHQAFGPYRFNPKREFFAIEPEQAVALLQLMALEDVTPSIQEEAALVDIDAEDATRRLKQRRPNLDFLEMGIPIGSELISIDDKTQSVVVASSRRVLFNGEETSLTGATREVLGLSYSVAPGPHWEYKGRRLRDIYNDTYDSA